LPPPAAVHDEIETSGGGTASWVYSDDAPLQFKKGKRSPYSITERTVPKLIPVLGSQPAADLSHKPGGRLPLFSARPAVILATLKGLLPISLLGEQGHDGCEQFA